jgi:peptidoglycan/LPS O-acetylase OafA/YrhL
MVSEAPLVERLPTLDALRGLAALGVALFHFTLGNSSLPPTDLLRQLGSWGWLGVDIFFVISGFVIPLSLLRKRHRSRDSGWFLVRRYLRVGLPYLAAALMAWLLWWASATFYTHFRGEAPPALTALRIGCHLGYACDFVDVPWLNIVFWTLAIEFQYYVVVSFVVPGLTGGRHRATVLLITASVLAARISPKTLVLAYSPLFVLGGLVLARMLQAIASLTMHAGVATMAAILWLRFGSPEAAAGVMAALAIAYLPLSPRPLVWLGSISFSLYLLHVPIGGRVLNLALRGEGTAIFPHLSILAAFVATLITSWIFYRIVEKPCQRWSQRAAGPAGRP